MHPSTRCKVPDEVYRKRQIFISCICGDEICYNEAVKLKNGDAQSWNCRIASHKLLKNVDPPDNIQHHKNMLVHIAAGGWVITFENAEQMNCFPTIVLNYIVPNLLDTITHYAVGYQQ